MQGMRTTLVTLALLAAPRLALACPVCFGDNDSPMAVAMNTMTIKVRAAPKARAAAGSNGDVALP